MRNQETSMELAFQRLPVSALDTPLGKRIFTALHRQASAHMKAPKRRDWDTNLSYRTYRQLAAKGVVQ